MNCWLYILLAWILLYLGWKFSSTARFYLKLTVYAVTSVISATAPIPLMLLNPRSSKNALLPAAGLRLVARHCLGLQATVRGHENIVDDTGCVVLINHQSVVDLIVLAELWPIMKRSTVISKKEIFYIWPFGLAAWLWGTIFIDRMNGSRAKESINKTGEIIKKRRAKVLMFPEGTRSQKPELLPFKKGAFHLAVASGCPIQPVVVNRYKFYGPRRFDNGVIEISILPPIPTENVSSDNIGKLIDKTYQVMQNHLNVMSADEVSNPNNNIDKSKDI